MSTARVQCSCTGPAAQFQDQRYGKNIRIANLVTKSKKGGSSSVDVKCTVCNKEHTVPESRVS